MSPRLTETDAAVIGLITGELEESARTKILLKESAELIARIADAIVETIKGGGKIVLCGNGGSAADAQHIAAEFVGQFNHVRKGLPAIALTVNTSVLTAVSNDFSYDDVFARQVEALVTEKDLVIGISTGGSSKNVVRAIEQAKQQGARTVGLLGKSGGLLATMTEFPLIVPSNSTQRIQEAHITVGHILCTLMERALFEVKPQG